MTVAVSDGQSGPPISLGCATTITACSPPSKNCKSPLAKPCSYRSRSVRMTSSRPWQSQSPGSVACHSTLGSRISAIVWKSPVRQASKPSRAISANLLLTSPGYARTSAAARARRFLRSSGMPPLGAKERAELPDSAFAYVASRGKRRLPIHDAAHVRNALARFSQVAFEDEGARDRARMRLLRASKKYGIVPIGFVSAQLQPQRKLPKGAVTFLLTDIEGSTELLGRLDDRYAPLLGDIRRLMRAAVRSAGGREASARGDDVFAVFERAPAALEAAVAIQRAMQASTWPDGVDVRVRIGVHRGRPTLTDTGYVGLSVHAAARICFAAHGGQIVVSSAVRSAVVTSLADGISLRSLGTWRFQGLREPEDLYQVESADLLAEFPPLRSVQ